MNSASVSVSNSALVVNSDDATVVDVTGANVGAPGFLAGTKFTIDKGEGVVGTDHGDGTAPFGVFDHGFG